MQTLPGMNRGQLFVGKKLAMCLSVGCCTESYLIDVPAERKVKQKLVTILLHTQEGERYGAFVCMAFHAKDHRMVAQLSQRGLSFSTMSQNVKTSRPTSQMVSPVKSPLASRIAAKGPSFGAFSTSNARTSKDFDDDGMSLFYFILFFFLVVIRFHRSFSVPVYDAREHTFNFKEDLDNIGAILPTYPHEIPFGSCVIVAHSLTSYGKNGEDHLSTNIQWVVILGIPDNE